MKEVLHEFFIGTEGTARCPTCKGTGEVPCINRECQTPMPDGLGTLLLTMVSWDPEKKIVRSNFGFDGRGIQKQDIPHALEQATSLLDDNESRRRFLKALFRLDEDEEVDKSDLKVVAGLKKLEALLIVASQRNTKIFFDQIEEGN